MRSLTLPTVKTTDYLFKIYNFRDIEKIDRFKNCSGVLLLHERLYLLRAERSELEKFGTGNPVANFVSKNELMSLYDKKFVKGNGRDIYLDIYNSINTCPSCLLRDVDEVDHFLPKSEYPIFSVLVYNLVPICEKCNGIKKAQIYDRPFIHPYFDDVSTYEWLYVNIIYGKEIGFEYYIKLPGNINPVFFDKINNHMSRFNLYEVYSSKASSLHSNIFPALKNIFTAGGKDIVESALEGYYEGATRETLNNYEAAFYKALLKDNYIKNYLSLK